MAANNTAEVSNTKGVLGGYGFTAPTTATIDLSTNPFVALGTGFENMGYISEDGIEEEIDSDVEEIHDMNGETVFVAKSTETETLVLTLISLNAASLGEMYGHSNVDTTNNDYFKVSHTAAQHDTRKYVFDLVRKDGKRYRKYVPNGQVTEVGSIVHASSEVFGREITITCLPDADGVRMYDYFEK